MHFPFGETVITMKRKIILSAVLSALLLSGCNEETELVNDTQTSQSDPFFQTEQEINETVIAEASGESQFTFGGETEPNAVKQENSEEQTDFSADIQRMIDEVDFPEINITENSTPEEIMLAGKTAGNFYSSTAEKYFEYGVNFEWKIDSENSVGSDYIGLGLYTDRENDVYAPMNGIEAKQFLKDYLRLTEQGIYELCVNCPSSYTMTENEFYVHSGDGGGAGWSYSCIIDYEMRKNINGELTVTYSCARVGDTRDWGYDENLVKPFTFRLAEENGVWKLDGCSYGEGLFEGLILFEDEVDAVYAQTEE